MVVEQQSIKGDVLSSLPLDFKREGIKTVINLTEADRVQSPFTGGEGKIIRHGVERDTFGRVKGYWVARVEQQENLHNFQISKNIHNTVSIPTSVIHPNLFLTNHG